MSAFRFAPTSASAPSLVDIRAPWAVSSSLLFNFEVRDLLVSDSIYVFGGNRVRMRDKCERPKRVSDEQKFAHAFQALVPLALFFFF